MTHYDTLGVSSDASDTEIRQNYRRLVKLYHPDLNPSDEARELIVKITEAYEVLSDPDKRHAYNWSLLGQPVNRPVPVTDERELRRKEYIRRKKQQDRERWERQLKARVRFYKIQRHFSWLFIAVSLLYTFDYLVKPPRGPFPLGTVTVNHFGETSGRVDGLWFATDRDFIHEIAASHPTEAYVHFSGIFHLPVGISLDGEQYHHFHGSLHAIYNIPAYLLLFFAAMLLANRRYSDTVLTLGLLPFFVLMYLLLLTYMEVSRF